MSFFIRNSRGRATTKRKYNNHVGKGGDNSLGSKSKRKSKSVPHDNESIGSTDEELAEEQERGKAADFSSDVEEDEEETAQEKRLRIARKHVQEIEEEERDRAEFEQGAIARRLHQEYLEEKGHLKKTVASNYTGYQEFTLLKCKHQKDSITCLCVSSNGLFLYSGSKDGTLVKWSLAEKVKLKVVKGKRKKQDGMKNLQCIAVSTDNKYLVVGDRGCNGIRVLCGNTLDFIKILQGHREAVTGLVFRKNTHTLYSASEDRCVKVWNLDDMAYVETLFGHQTGITSIDALTRERAITSGGFDKSIRIWKIVEESQLIFNGHGGSIDSVKLINEENFFSCGDDGRLCVWGCLKKVPLCTVFDAHGKDEFNGEPMWISSIATLLNTDLVASGSRNGVIKLWRCGHSFKSLDVLFEIQLVGFINALVFTPDGNYLIAGVGQEHRLGRWWRIPEAKNSIVIIPLVRNQTEK